MCKIMNILASKSCPSSYTGLWSLTEHVTLRLQANSWFIVYIKAFNFHAPLLWNQLLVWRQTPSLLSRLVLKFPW